jgi:DNA-binding transcriptional MerR regulator
MYSIGQIARRTGIKVPTIRYYEEVGLIFPADRTEGNQRRYDKTGLEQLAFIKHARELGFPIGMIASLIDLQRHPDRSCSEANQIATAQLAEVRQRIERLKALESELDRIVEGCTGEGVTGACHVLASLADHSNCRGDH